jgi:hypothetical protein
MMSALVDVLMSVVDDCCCVDAYSVSYVADAAHQAHHANQHEPLLLFVRPVLMTVLMC